MRFRRRSQADAELKRLLQGRPNFTVHTPRHLIASALWDYGEDEFSLILEGRVWFITNGEEQVAEVGDLAFKPRGGWHTFFNASYQSAPLLELISPGGLEEAFRIIDSATEDFDLGPVIAPYGCQGDFEATVPLIEKYGLTFG